MTRQCDRGGFALAMEFQEVLGSSVVVFFFIEGSQGVGAAHGTDESPSTWTVTRRMCRRPCNRADSGQVPGLRPIHAR